MRYCGFCGNALQNNESCSCAEAVQKTLKRKRMWLCLSCAVVAVALFALIFMGALSAAKVDAFHYVDVSFVGYNTRGSAVASVDREAMLSKIVGEKPSGDDISEYLEWDELYTSYSKNIQWECSPSTGLSNGDEVVVTLNVTGEASKKIHGGSKTYKVTGLVDIETVDVFSQFEIVFTGVEGNSEVRFQTESPDEYINACRFSIEPSCDFKNGDVVTVTITNEQYLTDTYQALPSAISKEYTVSGLGSYITNAVQVPQKELEELAAEFLALQKEERQSDSMFSYENIRVEGCFLMEHKNNYKRNPYSLWIVVSCDEYVRGEYDEKLYFPLKFDAPTLQADGSLNFKLEDGSHATFFSGEEFPTEDICEDYIVTRIEW